MQQWQRGDRLRRLSPSVRPAAGMPRRFGVGALVALTALFATVFAVATSLGASPVLVGGIGVFFVGIGLGQMVLYGGKDPRRASVVSGAVLLPVLYVAGAIAAAAIRGERISPRLVPGFFSVALVGAILGMGFGYLAGALIAGLFLRHADDGIPRAPQILEEVDPEQPTPPQSPFDDWPQTRSTSEEARPDGDPQHPP